MLYFLLWTGFAVGSACTCSFINFGCMHQALQLPSFFLFLRICPETHSSDVSLSNCFFITGGD